MHFFCIFQWKSHNSSKGLLGILYTPHKLVVSLNFTNYKFGRHMYFFTKSASYIDKICTFTHILKIPLRLQDPSGDSISCITPLKKIGWVVPELQRNRHQVFRNRTSLTLLILITNPRIDCKLRKFAFLRHVFSHVMRHTERTKEYIA